MLVTLAFAAAYVWGSRYGIDLVDEGYFLDLASRRSRWQTAWLRRLAELRCERKDFRWPLEMMVIQRLWPAQKLS